MPELHEFFANEVSTGIKFATVPMLDPPMMAETSTQAPSRRQALPLLIVDTTRRELDWRKVSRLEFSGDGSTCDLLA